LHTYTPEDREDDGEDEGKSESAASLMDTSASSSVSDALSTDIFSGEQQPHTLNLYMAQTLLKAFFSF